MMENKKQLGTILVEKEIIANKTLERALERQKGSGKRLGVILEEMGVITERELVDTLARQFGFKTVKDFAGYSFASGLLDLIHEDMAVQRTIFPLKNADGILAVAINDPFDNDTFEFIGKKTGLKIMPVLATREDILAAIKKHYLRNAEPVADKRKILVVDDSQPIATIIEVALKKEGYAVTIGQDGLEGLKMALSEKPELIICDSIMPRMDGNKTFDRIQEIEPGMRVILSTGYAINGQANEILRRGCKGFIKKPFNLTDLSKIVRKVLDEAQG